MQSFLFGGPPDNWLVVTSVFQSAAQLQSEGKKKEKKKLKVSCSVGSSAVPSELKEKNPTPGGQEAGGINDEDLYLKKTFYMLH